MLSLPILFITGRGLVIRGTVVGCVEIEIKTSILLIRSLSNRQQAIEAVKIAAAGKVKCRYSIRGLSELERYAGYKTSAIFF